MKKSSKLTAKLRAGLRLVPAFGKLSEEKLDDLLAAGVVVRFEPGETIVKEGDPADCSYILLEGTASIRRNEVEVIRRGAGEWLGEVALLDSPVRSATARAETPVTALMVLREAFEMELGEAEFARSLLRTMAAKVREGDVLIQQAMRQMRQLQALKEDLISLIVHDLRAPLASLKLAAGLVRKGEGTPDILDGVARSTDYMATMLADVLDVNLLEGDEMPLVLERVQLPAVVREAAETLDAAARVRRLKLAFKLPRSLSTKADRKLVRRAVENLLSNAIKHAPEGSSISVTLKKDGESAIIEVADCGQGIPPEFKGLLFKKYGSLELKRGSTRRGYGLGLHLVSLVATAHGGSVAVQDNPGGGSIFRLTLPAGR